MLWAIYCVDKADTAPLRDQHMRSHLDYLDRRKSILVLAGAMLTDQDSVATGSLFIINVQTRSKAEAFSAGDPFTKAGIFERITVTRMRKSQWNPQAADNA
ncbi:MAG TPA: YciI family protein [Xanthobacteraceae bacterium]|jgi:hypothetical protein